MSTDWMNFAVDITTVVILMALGIFLFNQNGFESFVSALLIVMFTRYYRR